MRDPRLAALSLSIATHWAPRSGCPSHRGGPENGHCLTLCRAHHDECPVRA